MTTSDFPPDSLTPHDLDRLAELALSDSLAFERFWERLITRSLSEINDSFRILALLQKEADS